MLHALTVNFLHTCTLSLTLLLSVYLPFQFEHTALIIAAINDNQNISEYLIAKEANLDLQDEVKELIVHAILSA